MNVKFDYKTIKLLQVKNCFTMKDFAKYYNMTESSFKEKVNNSFSRKAAADLIRQIQKNESKKGNSGKKSTSSKSTKNNNKCSKAQDVPMSMFEVDNCCSEDAKNNSSSSKIAEQSENVEKCINVDEISSGTTETLNCAEKTVVEQTETSTSNTSESTTTTTEMNNTSANSEDSLETLTLKETEMHDLLFSLESDLTEYMSINNNINKELYNSKEILEQLQKKLVQEKTKISENVAALKKNQEQISSAKELIKGAKKELAEITEKIKHLSSVKVACGCKKDGLENEDAYVLDDVEIKFKFIEISESSFLENVSMLHVKKIAKYLLLAEVVKAKTEKNVELCFSENSIVTEILQKHYNVTTSIIE